MAKKKTKRKVGRPKRKFPPEQMASIEEMAYNNCHTLTIANTLGIAESTLRDNFRELLTQKRAEGKAELRKNQRELAVKNPAMAIFLGKNELGQSDKQQLQHSADKSLAQLISEACKGSQ